MVLDQIEQAACVTLPNRSLCILQIGLPWKDIDSHLTCCIMSHYVTLCYMLLHVCYIKYFICMELKQKDEEGWGN